METFTSENCQKKFMALRAKTQRIINKFDPAQREEAAIDAFNDICLDASKNDPIAQDYLAYIFKKGLRGIIAPNHEKYMQWQILAAANGNQYSIDKLSLFLNFALTEVLSAEDVEYIIRRNNLTESNYQYVLGRLLCEGIADELRLDPESLVKEPLMHKEFDPAVMRAFDRARNFVIPKVLKFLRN